MVDEIYHIVVKSNGNMWIYKDDEDKIVFLNKVSSVMRELNLKIACYCIMSNHLHMVAIGERKNITTLLRKINRFYTYYYNNKYNNIGSIFKKRQKILKLGNVFDLKREIRYIHLNPVKANICSTSMDYPWSSFNTISKYLSGNYNPQIDDFIDYELVSKSFGINKQQASIEFLKYHNEESDDSLTYVQAYDKNEQIAVAEKYLESRINSRHWIKTQKYNNTVLLNYLKTLNKNEFHQLIYEIKKLSKLPTSKIAEILFCSRKTVSSVLNKYNNIMP